MNWRIQSGGQILGPWDRQTLREALLNGKVLPTDPSRDEHSGKILPLIEVDALFPPIPDSNPSIKDAYVELLSLGSQGQPTLVIHREDSTIASDQIATKVAAPRANHADMQRRVQSLVKPPAPTSPWFFLLGGLFVALTLSGFLIHYSNFFTKNKAKPWPFSSPAKKSEEKISLVRPPELMKAPLPTAWPEMGKMKPEPAPVPLRLLETPMPLEDSSKTSATENKHPSAKKPPPKEVPKKAKMERGLGAIPSIKMAQNFKGEKIKIGPLHFSLSSLENCEVKCQLTMYDNKNFGLKITFFKAAYEAPLVEKSTDLFILGRINTDGQSFVLSGIE